MTDVDGVCRRRWTCSVRRSRRRTSAAGVELRRRRCHRRDKCCSPSRRCVRCTDLRFPSSSLLLMCLSTVVNVHQTTNICIIHEFRTVVSCFQQTASTGKRRRNGKINGFSAKRCSVRDRRPVPFCYHGFVTCYHSLAVRPMFLYIIQRTRLAHQ